MLIVAKACRWCSPFEGSDQILRDAARAGWTQALTSGCAKRALISSAGRLDRMKVILIRHSGNGVLSF
jgi:hypothetical protein